MEIHPAVWRSFETPALDFIWTGDIVNLKKVLATGGLSIWDSIPLPWSPGTTTLLGVSTYEQFPWGCMANVFVARDLPSSGGAMRLSVEQRGAFQTRRPTN